MRFDLQPGNAFGCNINAHRSNWDGTICKAASSWTCGTKQEFRDDYCENGDPRCYHIHAFAETNPFIVIDDNGGSWLFGDEPQALDDQILMLWGGHAMEPRGIRDAQTQVVFGAFRVRSIEERPRNSFSEWVVRPYADGWTRFPKLKIPVPRWEGLPGPYLKQVDRSAVERVFQRAALLAKELSAGSETPDISRLNQFVSKLPGWLDQAAKQTLKLRARHPAQASSAAPSSPTISNRVFKDKDLAALKIVQRPTELQLVPAPAKTTSVPHRESAGVSTGTQDIWDPAVKAGIAARHGQAVLTAVQIGLMTKPLLILRGSPGVGKSDLARSLIEDPKRERMRIITVDPTWRGREDLLGHVDPIQGHFVPTEVTNFLRDAALAWDRGDQRTHLLVFEEFNLSQPEHWLSELLVRSQYPPTARIDRTITLGNGRVEGWGEKERASVYLSPAVRMVGTINSDHTVRPLSPRVLDRAAVIELGVQPHEALRRVGLELDQSEMDAVAGLDFKMRERGAVFSYRTAESLKACLGRLADVNIDRKRALDLVLLQEVLSKVRFLAGDPADVRLCEDLVEWTETEGKGLLECQRVIAGWLEALQNGQDVQQT